MKRILLGIISVTMIALTGCSKQDEILGIDSITPETLSIDMFSHYGEMHNKFIANAYKNFVEPRRIANIDAAIDYICQFNIAFVDSLRLSDDERNLTISALHDYKRFVNTRAFYAEFFEVGSKNGSDKSLYYTLIDEAASVEAIDDFELEQVSRIGQLLQENHDGLISDEELYSIILKIKEQWEGMDYTVESNKGQMLGVILSISLASLEWWTENPEAAINHETRIAPWVAGDIAGAVIGAASSAVNGAIGGEITAGGVGRGALIGAVAGSTGAVSKLAKVIQKVL